jgi:glyoxylase-like metal-dependent hydrolase (beta-lactamase superfamily II)
VETVAEVAPGLYSKLFRDWLVHVYYLVDSEGVTIVDTGGAGSADKILDGLRELGKQPSDVRRIVLTHGHQDHAGSASKLASATGATVHVHGAEAAHVRNGTDYPKLKVRTLFGRLVLLKRPPTRVEATPEATELTDGDEIAGLRVVHTPGHSPGHVVLLWPRHGGVLIVGDAAFNVPYLAAAPLYQDLDALWSSLRKVCALEFEIACFGHGKPISSGAAERFRKKFAGSAARR